VLEMNSAHAPAHFQLGLLLAEQRDKAQASAELEKAIRLAPGLVEAHVALGKLAKESQDWATAVRQFEAVVAWKPKDAAAHYDLAAALKASGQSEEAEHEIRLAQELDHAGPFVP
jgi:tetratricopeptide (TPR) repeat protein